MDVNLDQATKGIAIASTALYGFQFYIYNTYYARIGVSPEEIGVTNSFLLPRAAGFVVIFGTVLACFLFSVYLYRGFSDGPVSMLDLGRWILGLLIGFFLGNFLASRVAPENPGWFGFAVLMVVIFLAPITAVLSKELEGAKLIALLSMSSLALALLIVAGLAARAGEVADRALKGEQVEPVTIARVPVLDVTARNVSVTWIGGAGQQPVSIFGSTQEIHSAGGLLLGQSTTAVILRLADGCQIVRLPPTQVSVVFVPAPLLVRSACPVSR